MRRWAAALAADVAAVVVFATLGRRNHGDVDVSSVLLTASPFVMALALSWWASQVWRQPVAVRSAVPVWLGTVSLGMLIRRIAFDRGTAVSFVIVATLALGALLLGWRAALAMLQRRAMGLRR
jgi:poly(A) polymerase Pap1